MKQSSIVYKGKNSYCLSYISDFDLGQHKVEITFLDPDLDTAQREFIIKALCYEYDRIMDIINAEILDTTISNEWLP